MDFMSRSFAWLALLVMTVVCNGVAMAHAEEAAELQNKSYWMCKNKHDVRTIRVHVDDGGTCSTYYSREGSEKRVGSGRIHESCINVLKNIKTNLEKSNWSCRDITDTKITADLE
jgi:hypothetical protein